MTSGTQMRTAPDGPEIAGRPIEKAYSLEYSFIPDISMRDKAFRVIAGVKTSCPLVGHTPVLARVAAITAWSSVVVSKHKHCQINSSFSLTLPPFLKSP